jgi:murein DD-endopeptidase MepM/ murein hydrolase activator NlpD
MRYKFAYPVSRRVSSVLAIALLASVSSACSTGVTRFNENPFSNPFQARYDQTTTGSIKKAALKPQTQALSSVKSTATNYSSKISSSPLPAPGSTQAKIMMAGAASSASSKMTVAKSIPGWSAKGATPVTLGSGESVETVANRYGVPPAALLSVNGLSNSSQAIPGQRLLIPAYNAASGSGLPSSGLPSVSGAAGAAKKLGVKSLSSIDFNPLKINFSQTYYAFSDLDKAQDAEAIDPAQFLGFAPIEKLDKVAVKKVTDVAKTPSSAAPKKVRAVSNIAAPISVKAPKSVAVAKPVKVEPVKVAAKPKVESKQKIIAAAPKKQIIRTVAAKPSIVVSQKPLKQVADNPATTSKVVAKPKSEPKPKLVAAAKPTKIAVKPAKIKPASKVAAAKVIAPKTAVTKPKQLAIVAGVGAAGVLVGAKTKQHDADVKKVEAAPINSDVFATGSLPPTLEASANDDKGLFRWPVRGRVISSFGAKELSGTNNGINIAVPDGTPVKAAEVGTVAYAGDDVKKYGKLVLIKHENGYVSAYAHNGELNVKKGDMVKRGQVIAKSGATGDVASPQLHFQIRKGEQPMDPSKLLDAG